MKLALFLFLSIYKRIRFMEPILNQIETAFIFDLANKDELNVLELVLNNYPPKSHIFG